jgi:LPS export ABC transporter permease LptG/LPS export ABC transporter permease LptF
MRITRRFVISRAIVKEMLPTLILAAGVSTFLLLIRFIFILADLFLTRSVRVATGLELVLLGVPNILALTLPIGTLFAVLMTAGRWASDSELVAAQACGIPLRRVARPLALAAGCVFLVDLGLTLSVMPRANARLSQLTRQVMFSAANAAVEQRVFAEDFPGQLLYVDKIDRGSGRWHGVLLFDATNPEQESLVTADSGDLVIDPRDGTAWLNLQDTTTHLLRPEQPDSYRKNDNNELKIRLRQAQAAPGQQGRLGVRETLTEELLARVRGTDRAANAEEAREASVELNKRVAIPAAAVVFALVGFPLGIRNRRGGKGFGLTASVALVVAYYVLLNNGELLATGGKIPVALGMWLPNLALLAVASGLFYRVSRGARGGSGIPVLPRMLASVGRAVAAPFRGAAAVVRGSLVGRNGAGRNGGRAGPARLPGTLGVVDRYVLRQCAGFFVLVLIAVCSLWIAVDLSSNLEDIRRFAVPFVTVASYYLFSLPQILHDTVPIAFLIAFLATATVLERRNETTAFKAAGISLSRLTVPLLVLGVVAGAGLFLLDDHVTQRAERSKQQLEDVIRGRKVARSYRATDRPFVFLPDGRTLVNFLEFDPDTDTLVRPSVFVFDARFNLRSRYMAKRASFADGKWRAEGAWSRTFIADATPEFVTYPGSVDLPLPVTPEYFGREYRRPEQMSFAELRGYIATLRAAGYRVDRLVVQLHQKLAYPFSVVLLAWLSLSFAFRPGRSRNTVGGIALAMVLGMAYFALMAFVTRLGEAAVLPPALASWTPSVVFALLAINRHTTLRT